MRIIEGDQEEKNPTQPARTSICGHETISSSSPENEIGKDGREKTPPPQRGRIQAQAISQGIPRPEETPPRLHTPTMSVARLHTNRNLSHCPPRNVEIIHNYMQTSPDHPYSDHPIFPYSTWNVANGGKSRLKCATCRPPWSWCLLLCAHLCTAHPSVGLVDTRFYQAGGARMRSTTHSPPLNATPPQAA